RTSAEWPLTRILRNCCTSLEPRALLNPMQSLIYPIEILLRTLTSSCIPSGVLQPRRMSPRSSLLVHPHQLQCRPHLCLRMVRGAPAVQGSRGADLPTLWIASHRRDSTKNS
ncbi:hypothetical protein CDAR_395072, partial [Caerostris darwini]